MKNTLLQTSVPVAVLRKANYVLECWDRGFESRSFLCCATLCM